MSNELQYSYRWKPIEDIPVSENELASPELKLLANIWREQATLLATSQVLKRFNEKLARHWAIETGVIEGIYKIERGVTELLIEKGIESALIPFGTTDKPAEEIVAILQDHQNVLEGLFDFVAKRRSLTTAYIKELHQELCAHQHDVDAKDSQGRFFKVTLRKGIWKQHPNNPHRQDGLVHEYCPPEQVASEMDRLIEMHLKHTADAIPPEMEAAWLHHRFTQIHPFQDGNGRVARALATLVLLRAKLFPFTVDRSEKDFYISHLESADAGALGPFLEMLASSQRRALRKALSLSEGVLTEEKDIDAVILSGAKGLQEKKEAASKKLENVYILSRQLQDLAHIHMSGLASKIKESLERVDPKYDCTILVSTPETDHWFRTQVIETAKQLDYYADMRRYHHWARLRIAESQICSVIVSFHPLGTVFRGVMAVSAFYEERPRSSEDRLRSLEEEHSVVPMPTRIVPEVYEFVYSEDFETVKPRFEKWLHEALLVALTQWRESI